MYPLPVLRDSINSYKNILIWLCLEKTRKRGNSMGYGLPKFLGINSLMRRALSAGIRASLGDELSTPERVTAASAVPILVMNSIPAGRVRSRDMSMVAMLSPCSKITSLKFTEPILAPLGPAISNARLPRINIKLDGFLRLTWTTLVYVLGSAFSSLVKRTNLMSGKLFNPTKTLSFMKAKSVMVLSPKKGTAKVTSEVPLSVRVLDCEVKRSVKRLEKASWAVGRTV